MRHPTETDGVIIIFRNFALVAIPTFLTFTTFFVPIKNPSDQSTFHPPNARLEFHCPQYALPAQTVLLLTGEVIVPRSSFSLRTINGISYFWTVQGGSLTNGQGTPRVKIQPNSSPNNAVQSLTITVEPKHAPPETEVNKTCIVMLDPRCKVDRVDEYEAMSPNAEKERLNQIGAELLKQDRDSVIYVVSYGGKESCIREADWRSNRVKEYLVSTHKIDPNRIVRVDGGFRDEFAVTIFVSRSKDCGPLPTPKVLANNSRVVGACNEKPRLRD